MDLMSQAVDELRLRRATYQRAILHPPWAISLDEGERHVQLVLVGRAWLRAGGKSFELAAGDLALLPGGLPHELRGDEARGEKCELLSGTLAFEAPDHPLFGVLPPIIHATSERARPSAGYVACLEHLKAEALASRDGSDALVARLSEVLLIEVMRFFTPAPGVECPVGGWFAGLADPAIRRALVAIHEEPAKSWTVASLAKVARESRSAFAAHFASVMREPPMAYLARWRMFRARALLRQTELPLAAIAEQVGYGSAAALSLAFTRAEGTSPGTFRSRSRRAAATGAGERAG
jgi:AraC-like DNA-binding protein